MTVRAAVLSVTRLMSGLEHAIPWAYAVPCVEQ